MPDFVCVDCGNNVALLIGADGKQRCTNCLEAMAELGGVEPESLRMIKVLEELGAPSAETDKSTHKR